MGRTKEQQAMFDNNTTLPQSHYDQIQKMKLVMVVKRKLEEYIERGLLVPQELMDEYVTIFRKMFPGMTDEP